jgi:hypothetical protein
VVVQLKQKPKRKQQNQVLRPLQARWPGESLSSHLALSILVLQLHLRRLLHLHPLQQPLHRLVLSLSQNLRYHPLHAFRFQR